MPLMPDEWNTRPEPTETDQRLERVCEQVTNFNEAAIVCLVLGLICYLVAFVKELMQ